MVKGRFVAVGRVFRLLQGYMASRTSSSSPVWVTNEQLFELHMPLFNEAFVTEKFFSLAFQSWFLSAFQSEPVDFLPLFSYKM